MSFVMNKIVVGNTDSKSSVILPPPLSFTNAKPARSYRLEILAKNTEETPICSKSSKISKSSKSSKSTTEELKKFKTEDEFIQFLKSDRECMKKFITRGKFRKNFPKTITYVVFEVVENATEYLSEMPMEVCKSYNFFNEAIVRNRVDVVNYLVCNPEKMSDENINFDRIDNLEILKLINYHYPERVKSNLIQILARCFLEKNADMFEFIFSKYGVFKYFKVAVKDALYRTPDLGYYAARIIFDNCVDNIMPLAKWTVKVSDERVVRIFQKHNLLNRIDFLYQNLNVTIVRTYYEEFGILSFQNTYCRKICQKTLMSAFYPHNRKEMKKFSRALSKIDIRYDRVFNIKNLNRLLPYVLPDIDGKTIDDRISMYSYEEALEVIESFKNFCYPQKIDYDFETRIWSVVE